jgi:hypothetical protein
VWIRHAFGAEEDDPAKDTLVRLIGELDTSDAEHGAVSISTESGWTLSAHRDGSVVWENVERDDEPRHMQGQARDRMVSLFAAVADGHLQSVEEQPWRYGYPSQRA